MEMYLTVTDQIRSECSAVLITVFITVWTVDYCIDHCIDYCIDETSNISAT